MNPYRLFALFLVFAFVQNCHSQTNKPSVEFESLKTNTDASLRGLSVVNDSVVWASGSKATVIRTIDGGKTWKVTRVAEAGETEFRDVEAFGEDKAFILGAGSPAYVFQSSDGNNSWRLNFRNNDPKIFFDAFAFWDNQAGIGFSDPINQKLVLIRQYNGGRNIWQQKSIKQPKMFKNEAGFAASGTCLTVHGDQKVWIGLGGKPEANESKFARVLYSGDRGISWKFSETTIPRSESAGIFSLVFLNEKYGVAVGGDYKDPEKTTDNISITKDGGKTWHSPTGKSPSGFRSCITSMELKEYGFILVATGTNGTDISVDRGESWTRASMLGFHAIDFSKDKKPHGWASGANGRVARFKIVLPK